MKNLHVLAAILATASCGGGLSHTKVVDANVIEKVSGLDKIGAVTAIRASGKTLYAAGSTGLAALSADGKVIWTLQLPDAEARLLDADESGIALTSFDLAGVDRAEGLKAFILGNVGDEPTAEHQTVAYVDPAGKLLWSIEAQKGATQMSAPALHGDQVAVSRGKGLFAYSRQDGHQIFMALIGGSDAVESMVLQSSFNRPVFSNGNWYAAHLNHLVRVDPKGAVQDDSRTFGLFSPFQNITAGLLSINDQVIFGNSPWKAGEPARLWATDKEGGNGWSEKLNKDGSGVGALATNGSTIFVATNFSLEAYTPGGSKQWAQHNGKGGLWHGRLRGVRYLGNAFASTFAVRRTQTQQMVADQKNVYITSAYKDADALTVLDAKSGEYVDSIDVKSSVVDMALVGPSLALATQDGLEFIALQ